MFAQLSSRNDLTLLTDYSPQAKANPSWLSDSRTSILHDLPPSYVTLDKASV